MAEQTISNPLYLERCKLIRDAIGFNNPARVPYLGNYWTWKFQDAGYTIEDGARDYTKIMDANRQFCEKYPVDMLINDGFRNPLRVSDAIGATGYESTEDAELSVSDSSLFDASDYDAIAEDYFKALWERAVPRRCSALLAKGPEAIAEATREYGIYIEQEALNDRMIREEYGVALPPKWYLSPWELVFNCLRGIRGSAQDMRRCPDKLKAALKALEPLLMGPFLDGINASSEEDFALPFDVQTAWLGHTILSPKQFEEFYWPSMKPIFDACVEQGKKVYVFSEGNWLRFADFLANYPKGHIAMHVELDDIYEVREKVPNVCLVGGLDAQVMSQGTPEECVAMAKHAIEVLGSGDGGFILSENKMMSYACDSKPENVKAVAEFVQNQ